MCTWEIKNSEVFFLVLQIRASYHPRTMIPVLKQCLIMPAIYTLSFTQFSFLQVFSTCIIYIWNLRIQKKYSIQKWKALQELLILKVETTFFVFCFFSFLKNIWKQNKWSREFLAKIDRRRTKSLRKINALQHNTLSYYAVATINWCKFHCLLLVPCKPSPQSGKPFSWRAKIETSLALWVKYHCFSYSALQLWCENRHWTHKSEWTITSQQDFICGHSILRFW